MILFFTNFTWALHFNKLVTALCYSQKSCTVRIFIGDWRQSLLESQGFEVLYFQNFGNF